MQPRHPRPTLFPHPSLFRSLPMPVIAWLLGDRFFVSQLSQIDYDCPSRVTSGPVPLRRRSRTNRGTRTSPLPARRPAPLNGPAAVERLGGGVELRLGRPVACAPGSVGGGRWRATQAFDSTGVELANDEFDLGIT
jgi:hypothetical protein